MTLTNIFVTVINLSTVGIIVAGILLIIKFIFGEKLSASWHYYIWLILLIRLLVPVFPQSHVSVFNIIKLPYHQHYESEKEDIVLDSSFINTIRKYSNTKYDNREYSNNRVQDTDNISESLPVNVPDSNKIDAQGISSQDRFESSLELLDILGIIWFVGMILFLIYPISLNIYIRQSVAKCRKCANTEILYILQKCKDSLKIKSNVIAYECDSFGSPCIYGLIKPKLLVSNIVIQSIGQKSKEYVLLHELMHLKRKDLLVNSVLIILKAVYWFNPVLWYCFARIRRECEVSCDEMVLRDLNNSERIGYGKAIVEMCANYSDKKLVYPAMSMVHNKGDTKRRVKKVISFKKPSTIWIVIAVVVTLITCTIILTNGLSNSRQEVISESSENTKEGEDPDNTANPNTSKIHSKEEYEHYRQEYAITAVKNDCIAFTGPGEEFEEWCSLKKNTIIQITGRLDIEWFTAKKMIAMPDGNISDTDNPENLSENDHAEFWINLRNVYYVFSDQPLTFSSTQIRDAGEYSHMIKSDIEKQYCLTLDEHTECITVHMAPTEDSGILGYAFKNDMVRLKKDEQTNSIIKSGDWVLIEKIPFYWDNSDTGWIKEKYITKITEGMHPQQGFILRNTRIFKEPKIDTEILNDTYPDIKELKHIPVSCIHIRDKKEGWFMISAGPNSFTGWVREKDVYYGITDEIEMGIYNPEPDFDLFVSKLHSEITGNPSFVLKAEDTDSSMQLNAKQKEKLASAIVEISDYELFDGGISDSREAAYPFYRLDFGDYSLVVTTENKLLVLMDKNRNMTYDYGIGREGAPLRFLTPNIELIQTINELFPATPNTSKDNLNYLMNADKLIFGGDYSNNNEYNNQVHINKCVRAIKGALGKEIPADSIDKDSEEKSIFEFRFDDGSVITVVHTEKHIEFNDRYYESLMLPGHLMVSLFVAYF
jgi:beta-lactamase regulating signal transducer with metallopeptidase domain